MPTPPPVVKIIWARSAGLCAFPGCRRDVARVERGGKALTPAEVAHIVSESPAGPRGQYAPPGGSTSAAANYLLLCLEHHNEIDTVPDRYSVEKLVTMKAEHERWVTQTLGADAATLPEPAYCDELLHSSLLPATLLPQVVFAAPCSKPELAVRQALVYPPASELAFPFVVRGGDLLTFCDPTDQDSPFAPVVDSTRVSRHRLTDWYGDEDKMRWYVDLLNRTMNKLTGRRGLHFDKEHHRCYFPLGANGADRSADYLTLMGRRSSRNVAWRPRFRHSGEAKRHCEHLAVSLRFHHIGDGKWFLSVRPERRFTTDGITVLHPRQTGRKATKAKSRMYNIDYVEALQFWRDYLSNGSTRITLRFGTQSLVIDNRPLEAAVRWPGVGSDQPRQARPGREETLWSSAEYAAIIRESDELEAELGGGA